MKNKPFIYFIILSFTLTACDIYDISGNGIPKFVSHDFIELSKIKRISKFRSNAGHSYTDDYEKCRSMKHYYQLTLYGGYSTTDSAKVYSPVAGTIEKVMDEKSENGIQLWIKSSEYKAFTFHIFHIITNRKYTTGMKIAEGELLGKTTGTDIAVSVKQFLSIRMVSYFDVMTDDLLTTYTQRGVISRESMIITKEYRDANPCSCNGEEFTSPQTSDDFITLN